MLFILKQWADGHFINEIDEGWLKSPPYTPYLPYPTTPPKTGRELDRGVLTNVLGGAFCPGGEATWIMRNPAIYWEPYRFKADRSVSDFLLSPAQENTGVGVNVDYTFNVENPLSQDSDFVKGLQPGDITKYSALPWQTDFNECTNPTDITYADWNVNYLSQQRERRRSAQGHQGLDDIVVAGASATSIHRGDHGHRRQPDLCLDQLEQGHPADRRGRL